MKYNEAYQRNIGIFTEKQQKKLQKTKIAIFGLGGVGGRTAETFARYGIGEMSIVEPGYFDEPDMNRQVGATRQNIGKSKAQVMDGLLHRVNPFMKINSYDTAILNVSDLEACLEGSSLVIDAIDCSVYEPHMFLAKAARKIGLYNLFGSISDSFVNLMIYDPNGMTFEEFWPRIRKGSVTSSQAGTAAVIGGWIALEAAVIITGKRKKKDIVTVPIVRSIDLLDFKLYKYEWPQVNEK